MRLQADDRTGHGAREWVSAPELGSDRRVGSPRLLPPHSSDVEFTPEAMRSHQTEENSTITDIVYHLTFPSPYSSLLTEFLKGKRVIRAFDSIRSLMRIT